MPNIVTKEQNSFSFEDIRSIIKEYISDAEGKKSKGMDTFGLVFADSNGTRLESEDDVVKAAQKDGIFIIPRYSEEPFYIHYDAKPKAGKKKTLSYSQSTLNTDELMDVMRDKAYEKIRRNIKGLRAENEFLTVPEKPVWGKKPSFKSKSKEVDKVLNIGGIDEYVPSLTDEERINLSQMRDLALEMKSHPSIKRTDIEKYTVSESDLHHDNYRILDTIPLKKPAEIPQNELPKAPKLGFFASIAHKVKKVFDGKGTVKGRQYEQDFAKYSQQKSELQEKYDILQEKEEGIYEVNSKIRNYNKKIKANKALLESQKFKDYTQWTKMKRDYENNLGKYKVERSEMMSQYPLLGYVDLKKNGVTLDNLDVYYEALKQDLIGESFTKNHEDKLAELLYIKGLKEKYDAYKSDVYNPNRADTRERYAVSIEKGITEQSKKVKVQGGNLQDNRDIEYELNKYNDPLKREELIEQAKSDLAIFRTLVEYRGQGEITKDLLADFIDLYDSSRRSLAGARQLEDLKSYEKKNNYLEAKSKEKELISDLGNQPIGKETGLILAKLKLIEKEAGFTKDIKKSELAFKADVTNEKDPGYEILNEIAENDPSIKALCEENEGKILPGDAINGLYLASKKAAQLQENQKTV